MNRMPNMWESRRDTRLDKMGDVEGYIANKPKEVRDDAHNLARQVAEYNSSKIAEYASNSGVAALSTKQQLALKAKQDDIAAMKQMAAQMKTMMERGSSGQSLGDPDVLAYSAGAACNIAMKAVMSLPHMIGARNATKAQKAITQRQDYARMQARADAGKGPYTSCPLFPRSLQMRVFEWDKGRANKRFDKAHIDRVMSKSPVTLSTMLAGSLHHAAQRICNGEDMNAVYSDFSRDRSNILRVALDRGISPSELERDAMASLIESLSCDEAGNFGHGPGYDYVRLGSKHEVYDKQQFAEFQGMMANPAITKFDNSKAFGAYGGLYGAVDYDLIAAAYNEQFGGGMSRIADAPARQAKEEVDVSAPQAHEEVPEILNGIVDEPVETPDQAEPLHEQFGLSDDWKAIGDYVTAMRSGTLDMHGTDDFAALEFQSIAMGLTNSEGVKFACVDQVELDNLTQFLALLKSGSELDENNTFAGERKMIEALIDSFPEEERAAQREHVSDMVGVVADSVAGYHERLSDSKLDVSMLRAVAGEQGSAGMNLAESKIMDSTKLTEIARDMVCVVDGYEADRDAIFEEQFARNNKRMQAALDELLSDPVEEHVDDAPDFGM